MLRLLAFTSLLVLAACKGHRHSHKRTSLQACDVNQAISACRSKCDGDVEDEVDAADDVCKGNDNRCCRAKCGERGSMCMYKGANCPGGFKGDGSGSCPGSGATCCIPSNDVELPPGDVFPWYWPYAYEYPLPGWWPPPATASFNYDGYYYPQIPPVYSAPVAPAAPAAPAAPPADAPQYPAAPSAPSGGAASAPSGGAAPAGDGDDDAPAPAPAGAPPAGAEVPPAGAEAPPTGAEAPPAGAGAPSADAIAPSADAGAPPADTAAPPPAQEEEEKKKDARKSNKKNKKVAKKHLKKKASKKSE